MVRRASVLLSLVLLGLVGCDVWKPALRSSDSGQPHALKSTRSGVDPTAVDSDTSKILAVDGDAKNPSSFFKNSRRSGGLSSEAREIESHLGIGR
ncbi:MAG: hypothetical protein U0790_22220 [Isosphaeraceae bacterium]